VVGCVFVSLRFIAFHFIALHGMRFSSSHPEMQ
jgi:hypothetical protein